MKLMRRWAGVVRSSLLVRVLACVIFGVMLASQAEAGAKRKPAVLYIHADSFAPPSIADVQNKLTATGLFSVVQVFDGGGGTPTLAQLNAYDAVLVTNDGPWSNSTALGTVLAQYVDGGGGVVQSVFTSAGVPGSNLAGAWTATYNCIVFGSSTSGVATLGSIPDQNHPIMIGVAAFNGGTSSFRPSGTALTAGATLVASWSDGKPLVAVGPKINRCDLGFYPVSNDALGNGWVSNTDGVKMMANALLYVMRPRVILVQSGTAGDNADVVAKVKGTNLFSVVDSFDASLATPTLAQMQKYDAALVVNRFPWNNQVALGNVLADFVDGGGGVVQTVFTTGGVPGSNLGGRWTGTYDIIPFGNSTSGASSLGAVSFPNHPIMAGVAAFSGGTDAYRPSTTALNSGGLIVAKWSDGRTLAAVSTRYPSRVDLGFWAVSSDSYPGGWNPATDGAKLLGNALNYTVKPYVVCVFGDPQAADVVAKLQASRRFSGVGSIDAGAATPALATLSPYNAVANWSNSGFADSTSLGNTLADFVDAGGGAVTAVFAVSDPTITHHPAGRWITQGYETVPSPLPSYISGPQAFLGTIAEPNNPIASFVRKFDGGANSFRANSTPLLRGRTILKWSDGKMLASVHNFRKAAALGYWPPSNAGGNNGWNQRTDGTWMTANALEFVVRAKPCPGDLNGDGQVDDSDFVLFAAYYDALLDPRGDLNGDGVTDDADFVIFAAGYDALVCP